MDRNAKSLCERVTELHVAWTRELTSHLGKEMAARKIILEEDTRQFSRFNHRIMYRHAARCDATPDLAAHDRFVLEHLNKKYAQEVSALLNSMEKKRLLRDQHKAYLDRTLAETPGIAEHDSARVIIYTSDLTGPCFLRADLNLADIRKAAGTPATAPSERQIRDVIFAGYEPLQSNLPNSLEFDKRTTDALLDEEAREGARVYLTRNPSPAVIPEDMITYLARHLMLHQHEPAAQRPAHSAYSLRGGYDDKHTVTGGIGDALNEVTQPHMERFWPQGLLRESTNPQSQK